MNKKQNINFFIIIAILCFLIAGMATQAQERFHWRIMIDSGFVEYPEWLVIAKEVEEKTEGRLKMDVFVPGEHPYKLSDYLQVIKSGDAEICAIIPGYMSGIEPGLSVLDLPLLIPNGNFEVYRELFNTFTKTYFQERMDNWNATIITASIGAGQNYYLKGGWIENSDSLKGKKIRSWSAEVSDFIKLMNGIPVTVALAENYTALQTGLLDGTTTNLNAALLNNFFDVCKNVVVGEVSFSSQIYVVNNDAWNSLPADIQQILKNALDERRKDWEYLYYRGASQVLLSAFVNFGVSAKPIPKEYRDELTKQAYESIWKAWINKSGDDGRESFKNVVKTLESMGYNIPVPDEFKK